MTGWRTIRCRQCNRRHRVEKHNAKYCSDSCSKAYRRDLARRRKQAASCPDKPRECTYLPPARTRALESRSLPGLLKTPRAAIFTRQTLSGDRQIEATVAAGENRREARERLARNVGAATRDTKLAWLAGRNVSALNEEIVQ